MHAHIAIKVYSAFYLFFRYCSSHDDKYSSGPTGLTSPGPSASTSLGRVYFSDRTKGLKVGRIKLCNPSSLAAQTAFFFYIDIRLKEKKRSGLRQIRMLRVYQSVICYTCSYRRTCIVKFIHASLL